MDLFDWSEGENVKVAYVIPSRWDGMNFEVRFTANAWWKDPTKVVSLLDAFDNHQANIEQACYAAGISIRQYKYFAQLHPLINKRRKLARHEMDFEKRRILAGAVLKSENPSPRAAIQWLRYSEPEEWDLRYKEPYDRLRRSIGLPAKIQPPKSPEEQLEDMRTAVEKTRKVLGHPSDPKHYVTCGTCSHLAHQAI